MKNVKKTNKNTTMKKVTTTMLLFLFLWGLANANPKENDKKDKLYPTYRNLFSTDLISPATQNNLLYPVWGFYFSGTGGLSKLNVNKDFNGTSSLGPGVSVTAGFFRALGPNLKLMTGLGLDLLSGDLKISDIVDTTAMKDLDKVSYIENYTISELNDKINPIYVSIPVVFEFGKTTVEKQGFYVDAGVRFSYLVNDGYKNKGGEIFTTGTYPQYDDLTIIAAPELGFVGKVIDGSIKGISFDEFAGIADYWSSKNLPEYAKDFEKYKEMVDMNKISIAAQFGVGATFPLAGGNYLLKTGLNCYYGLTDISGEDLSGKEQYMRNSIAAGPFKPKPLYIGLEIALYLNKEMR